MCHRTGVVSLRFDLFLFCGSHESCTTVLRIMKITNTPHVPLNHLSTVFKITYFMSHRQKKGRKLKLHEGN